MANQLTAAGVRTPIDRIQLIDSLRALALLGVIVMNVNGMAMRFAGGQVMAEAGPADIGLMAFDLVFVQGKARACFAFLFGVGFAMLAMKAEARGLDAGGRHRARMLVLLAFGLVNQAFLFWGDILCLYALLGLVLPLFRRLPQGATLKLGLLLVIAPPLVSGLLEATLGGPLPNLVNIDPASEAARGLAAMSSPDYLDFVRFSFSQAVLRRLTDTAHMIVYDANVLGLFLLGLWTGRRRVLADVAANRPLLRRIAWACLPLGLALSLVNASRLLGVEAVGPWHGLVTASFVGLPLLAFGYIAALALLFFSGAKRVQAILAPVGRMALTNYLASGALGCWVFYGYGLGLLGKVGITELNLIAAAIFTLLTVFSQLWLSRFEIGPAEHLWRRATAALLGLGRTKAAAIGGARRRAAQ
jgi:uncharacterized protein